MQLETVRIAVEGAPHGYVVINKTDLLPEHVLFEEAVTPPVTNDTPVQELVQAQSEMTVQELKDALAAQGIAYPRKANRAQLLALLPSTPKE